MHLKHISNKQATFVNTSTSLVYRIKFWDSAQTLIQRHRSMILKEQALFNREKYGC